MPSIESNWDMSFIGSRHGKHGQLIILDTIRTAENNCRVYLAKCDICAKDPELFGDGTFKVRKGGLKEGKLPCGCAKSVRWTEEQYKIRVKRECQEYGDLEFLGFSEDFKGVDTKLTLRCQIHNHIYTTNNLHKLFSKRRGCSKCKAESISNRWLIPHKEKESRITDRIQKENLQYSFLGWSDENYSKINLGCLLHGIQNLSYNNFIYNKTGCPQCGGRNLIEGYIQGIYDYDILIGIKFGISSDSIRRTTRQNQRNTFDVRLVKRFIFDAQSNCKAAEAACKKELVCGILSKQEMPDGYTETTSPLNLEKIIGIYKRHGAKEVFCLV